MQRCTDIFTQFLWGDCRLWPLPKNCNAYRSVKAKNIKSAIICHLEQVTNMECCKIWYRRVCTLYSDGWRDARADTDVKITCPECRGIYAIPKQGFPICRISQDVRERVEAHMDRVSQQTSQDDSISRESTDSTSMLSSLFYMLAGCACALIALDNLCSYKYGKHRTTTDPYGCILNIRLFVIE